MFNKIKSSIKALGLAAGIVDVPLFDALEVEISSSCNLRCATCPNRDHTRPEATLPLEVIHGMILELKALGYKGAFSPHFYNEPLLDPRLPEILAAVRRHLPNSNIPLFTNFTLMTPEMYRQLLPLVDEFVVSVNEPVVRNTIAKIECQLTAAERGKLRTRFLSADALSNRAGAVALSAKVQQPRLQCNIPQHYMVVDANGDTHLCCNDYFGKALYGNVKERKILDIWRDERFVRDRALAAQARHHLCRNCLWPT